MNIKDRKNNKYILRAIKLSVKDKEDVGVLKNFTLQIYRFSLNYKICFSKIEIFTQLIF